MARRTSFQVSIEQILEAKDLKGRFDAAFEARDWGTSFYVKLEKGEGWQPLVIQKVGPTRVAISHTYLQNGDIMRDPEIVFEVGTWEPVEITQSPMGIWRPKYIERDGQKLVDRYFARAVSPLVQMWARNIKWQGWTEAKVTAFEFGE